MLLAAVQVAPPFHESSAHIARVPEALSTQASRRAPKPSTTAPAGRAILKSRNTWRSLPAFEHDVDVPYH